MTVQLVLGNSSCTCSSESCCRELLSLELKMFDFAKLLLKEEIGFGSTATVVRGLYKGNTVAVKLFYCDTVSSSIDYQVYVF